MNIVFAGMIGGMELVLILAVVLILFGAKKLPELAKGLGQGIREFKKASSEVTSELQRSMDDDHNAQPPPRKAPPANTESATAAAAPKEPTSTPKA